MIGALIARDVRRGLTGAAWLPVAFFLLVATLMPFAVGPDAKLLARIAAGTLWIASFRREHYTTPEGRARTRLGARGTTVATVHTPTTHPGGIQAAGSWLAVANVRAGVWMIAWREAGGLQPNSGPAIA